MTVKHTPGPWVFAYGSVYVEHGLNDETSNRIALMDRNNLQTEPTERDSNARLIAAAPELLEACKWAEKCLSGTECTGEKCLGNGQCLDAIRAAIRKATT